MIRVLFLFLTLFVVFAIGIQVIRALSGKELWQLTKILAYATICSLLAVATMTALVVFF